MSLEGAPVVVSGKLADVLVVQVPTSASRSQIERVSKAIEEIVGKPPIVTTNNVTMLKLRRITENEAKRILGSPA